MTNWIDLKRRIDRHDFYDALIGLPDSFEEAVEIGRSISVNKKKIDNVLVCGMGGSAIPGQIAKDYCAEQMKVPIEIIENYDIPNYVGEKTLVISISHSGNTEEAISCFKQAKKRKAEIIVITTGGKLEKLAKDKNLILIPKTSQPRGALAYMLVPILEILKKYELIKVDYKETIKNLRKLKKKLDLFNDNKNIAKIIAKRTVNRLPVVYSVSFDSMAVRLRAQGINENSKMIAHANSIPSMSHNELTAWQSAQDLPYTVIFLVDRHAHKQNLKRYKITKKILEEKVPKDHILEIKSKGKGVLSRLLTLVYQIDMISYYTALLHNVQPTDIRYVEELKKRL